MPRVNRDLQRRMAARRERERRRPSADRTYRFAAPPPTVEQADDHAQAADTAETSSRAVETASRRSASARAATVDVQPARGARSVVHQSAAAFKLEYAYVLSDLRRVALVIGSLLVVLILLYFVLPH